MPKAKPAVQATTPAKLALAAQHALGTPGTFPVVGIGASAGGLDALSRLVSALPLNGGMAYILVQHLEPTHKSLMAELLAPHTKMPVREAVQGSIVEADHIYVIPAGVYLSVIGGKVRLSKPTAPHGSRLPIDFLLKSLAQNYEREAIAIILSGTGADGTEGIKSVHGCGGFVIAQDPIESEYDGMPQSAIASGVVDAILLVEDIPASLATHVSGSRGRGKSARQSKPHDALSKIIALLRTNTAHDFTLYKMGTLQRRIERRMAMASIPSTEMARYLTILKKDSVELNLLAADLLINVTSFFRDPEVFELLAATIVPDIIRQHPEDQPLRIWTAGCSTGEETYSIALVFVEAITAAKRDIKLCVFASDVDPEAVAVAREGHFPDTIAANVSAGRLARFFAKDEQGYTVLPELRATVVFTVQDLLADPPFSKLDFISCRNVLIYLGPEAQAKVVALFHFALQPSAILLLGTSETIGNATSMFEPVAKSERIYRHIGKNRPGSFLFSKSVGDVVRTASHADPQSTTDRPPALADLCRRSVLENYAPAAILINRRFECLYSVGPVETYLRIRPGYPTHDLLTMVPPVLRAKLRMASAKISRTTPTATFAGGSIKRDGKSVQFDVDVRRVAHGGDELILVAFVEYQGRALASKVAGSGARRGESDLEHELDVTRTDLAAAIHDLETSGEEHRAVNEEALSVNEEYQSANEELMTSKEELQSLNEELTALNGQLQETLERQRTTSNDLQNVLYSTNVATLFLDTELQIRFFTPATKSLFHLIPGDIGRPLTDLNALSADPELAGDARRVLADSKASDREIEAPGGRWFMRHILPYRTDTDGIEGVVITFTDITEKKASRKALELAKRDAETANLAKSRFLAAASHDLRQPLQSIALLTGLLAKASDAERTRSLIDRLDQTLATMSGMLNTMLDINQIEAGIVRAEPVDFCVGDLVNRIRGEFSVKARDQKLELCSVHSSRIVHSDPTMIEQMLRNLISNALKYTKKGKILIGCRTHGAKLKIEVWDTGMGIPPAELDAIFDEYHQIDNAARERSLGLGLGLSIVQRLGALLGHRVRVRSIVGKGSVFSIEVALEPATIAKKFGAPLEQPLAATATAPTIGTVLIVEDDPEVRDLLDQLLTGQGHQTVVAADGGVALAAIGAGTARPDLMLADFNLPGDMNGLQLAEKVREKLGQPFPVIILTGDISTATLRDVVAQNCVQLNKPVTLDSLIDVVERLLSPAPEVMVAPSSAAAEGDPTVYIVDDDGVVRSALRELLESEGRHVEDFSDCESFIAAYRPGGEACLLIDAYLPGIDGIELLRRLKKAGHHLPAIMITGSSAVPMAVEAMKVGAIDFLEKPVRRAALFASIDRALDLSRDATKLLEWQTDAAGHIDGLTKRQHEVMDMVLAGHPSKNIAADLHISQRTVENHRASIMKKTGAKSIPALARLALAAVAPVLAE